MALHDFIDSGIVMNEEFKLGAEVVFFPYEKGHKRYVVGYETDGDRLFYRLSDQPYNDDKPEKLQHFQTVSTGKCIEDSVLFIPHTEEEDYFI